jgi:glycosyltransferase involved in cell wall biosynthesis
MACGLPIVATQLAAFGIEPNNERDMFVTNDLDLFTNFVITLLTDNDLRRKIGSNARTLARKFDHQNAAIKLDKVLQESK